MANISKIKVNNTEYSLKDSSIPSWAKAANKPSYSTSQLTNDSNFVSDASYVHTDNNYTTTEKNKLSGIASGAEVNQNAFGKVTIGSSIIEADAKIDTLTLAAGSNVTLTPDTTNDKVTIAATDTTYQSKAAASGGTAVSLVTTGEKYTWNNKTSNTGTVTKVSTGVGLTGGDITTSGTVKAKLKSETQSTLTAADKGTTSNREYAVGVDASGYLSVNVPWTDTNTQTITGVKGNAESSYRTGNVNLTPANLGAAPLASPGLTGTPTAPTAADGTNTTQIATTAFVMNAFKANDAMIFKGTIGSSGATVTTLPATHYQGWTYRVITAGTYAGKACEIGDMIICVTDGTTATDAHWTVVQTNIDGAVTGPVSATVNNVAIFDGTSGKVIKDSGYTIAKSVPSNAVFTDTNTTYTLTQDPTDGHKITLTPSSGSSTTITIPDNNTTYNFSGTAFYSGSSGIAEHDANNAVKNGHYYYGSNGPSTSLGASTADGALYVQSYSDSWVGQIAQDYRNGALFVRGKNNGTWQNWQKVYDTAHKPSKSDVGLGDVANYDQSKAIKSISRSGTTFTYTALDNTTGTFTQQDTNTTYTFANGSNGSFTVTPSGGSALTVSIGKPSTAGTADVANSVAWGNVSGKPNRAGSDSDGGPAQTIKGAYTSNGGQQNPNYFGMNKVGFLMMNTTVNGNSQYKDWVIMDCYNGTDVGGGVALGVNRQSLGAYIMRSASARTAWAESAELIGTHNYTTYTVKKDGTGASGTWGISITGNADSATNADKLDGIHESGFILYGGNLAGTIGSGSPATDAKTYWVDNVPINRIKGAYNTSGTEWSFLMSKGGNNNYGSILKWGYNDTYFYILRKQGENWKTDDWQKMSAGYADSAGSASAVAWSGVSSKPNTLSGYGITDAKIANGVITLGSNTITPLTSHQTVTNKGATLSWGTATTVATIGGTNINVSLPEKLRVDGVTSIGTGSYVSHFMPCDTAASTAAKTASLNTVDYVLTEGSRVAVRFSNANTASSPTLNVNSTGAKSIYFRGVQITTQAAYKSLLAGVCEFLYDGTRYHLVGNYYDTTYSNATTSSAGLMSATDKTNLNNSVVDISRTNDIYTMTRANGDTFDILDPYRFSLGVNYAPSNNVNVQNNTVTNLTGSSGIKFEAGAWIVNAVVTWASSATGYRRISWSQDSAGSTGLGIAYTQNVAAVNGNNTVNHMTTVFDLTEERTYWLHGQQNSGSAKTATIRIYGIRYARYS